MNRHRFAMIVMLACPFAFAAAPPENNLSKPLRDLGNADPVVREHARQDLMSLKRPELDTLCQAVVQAHPLMPEQIIALHEIVTQVILADAATLKASDNTKGFLGARLEDCQVPGPDGKMRPAVLVCQCIPGFDAYRMFHTDDVILAVDGDAEATRDVQPFTVAIQSHLPGQSVSLQILRGGRYDTITVALSDRPASADNLNLPDLIETRSESIEQYWRTNFEPALAKSR